VKPPLSAACQYIECRLQRVVYSLSDGQWQYDLQAVDGPVDLNSGMQVYDLAIPFPENAICGEYEFSVIISTQYESEVARLNITVKAGEG
jgi:hypothetical protein